MSKTWRFKVELQGIGDTEEEAWVDAVESFAVDPGVPEVVGIDVDDKDCLDELDEDDEFAEEFDNDDDEDDEFDDDLDSNGEFD